MADDNILAGLEGFFQGIAGTAVPIIQNNIKARQQAELARQNDERDLQNKIRFMPYQLNQEKQLAAYNQGLKPAQTQFVVDEDGNQVGQPFVGAPGGGSVGITKVGKDTSADYISGLDILLGRPDLKDTIDPTKKYNKSMLPFLKPGAGTTKTAADNKDAVWAVSEIDRISPLNEKSSGGMFGALRQKGMSAMNMEDEQFRNTADVINSLKGLVARVLKSTFGGQLSDSERDYLNSIYGAAEKYNVAERRIAMTNVKRMLQNKIGQPTAKGGGALPADEQAEFEALQAEAAQKGWDR